MAASVWKGHIAFGLISIPVRLLRAARSERVPLRELHRADNIQADSPTRANEDEEDIAPSSPAAPSRGPVRIDRKREPEPPPAPEPVFEPVRRISVGQSSDERAPASSITKGYEYERGRFVTLAPEELRAIVPQTSSDMEITAFVRLPEIDPVYFEASYYVKPEDAGRKPYALLYEAMREAGFAAIGQFTMHRRERVAVLRPGPAGLLAHTIYFASEVRSDQEERADTSLVTPKEVALAKTLVNALAEPFDPSKYGDSYRERLEALIAAKVEGRQTAVVTATPHAKPVADIMEALRKSLEAVKKPAGKAEASKGRAVKRLVQSDPASQGNIGLAASLCYQALETSVPHPEIIANRGCHPTAKHSCKSASGYSLALSAGATSSSAGISGAEERNDLRLHLFRL